MACPPLLGGEAVAEDHAADGERGATAEAGEEAEGDYLGGGLGEAAAEVLGSLSGARELDETGMTGELREGAEEEGADS